MSLKKSAKEITDREKEIVNDVIQSHLQNMITACHAGEVSSISFFMALAETAITALGIEVCIAPVSEKQREEYLDTLIKRFEDICREAYTQTENRPDFNEVREKIYAHHSNL